MISRQSTLRMLDKANGLTGADLRSRYLKAFGVTDLTLTKIPGAFDPKYLPEWQAFVRVNDVQHSEPADRALLSLLSFVRYCKLIKIDPFNHRWSYRDPVTQTGKLDVSAIKVRLAKNTLDALFTAVNGYLLRLQLMRSFVLDKSKTVVVSAAGHSNLAASYLLKLRSSKDSFEEALSFLSGFLYDSEVPAALKPDVRVTKLTEKKTRSWDMHEKADVLMSSSSVFGWVPLVRTPAYSVHVTRARDNLLVIRVFVVLGPLKDATQGVTYRERAAMWSKYKPFQ